MSDPSPDARRPRAFRLNPAVPGALAERTSAAPQAATVTIVPQADAYAADPETVAPAAGAMPGNGAKSAAFGLPWSTLSWSGLSWGTLFWAAITGLLSLAFSLWLGRLIGDLFAATAALGWLGVALAGIALLALLALGLREVTAIVRQRRISHLHAGLALAHAMDDTGAARILLADLLQLYASRPLMTRSCAALAQHMQAIIDGRDLINIAERDLIAPLDLLASREIAGAAKRVSAVTALSPRALLDVLFVLAQSIRLLRRIAEIYGGRPGFFGFFRLARSVGAHLAITSGMAVGDSLVQQLVGHGIAARLSARLGEGVLNGLLTARVGLAAMAVCRPMPFHAVTAPGVRTVAPFLFGTKDAVPTAPA